MRLVSFYKNQKCFSRRRFLLRPHALPVLTLFGHQKKIFCQFSDSEPHLAAGSEIFWGISARFFPGIISCGEPPARSLIQFTVFPWHVSWHVSLCGFGRCQDVEERRTSEPSEASAAHLRERAFNDGNDGCTQKHGDDWPRCSPVNLRNYLLIFTRTVCRNSVKTMTYIESVQWLKVLLLAFQELLSGLSLKTVCWAGLLLDFGLFCLFFFF